MYMYFYNTVIGNDLLSDLSMTYEVVAVLVTFNLHCIFLYWFIIPVISASFQVPQCSNNADSFYLQYVTLTAFSFTLNTLYFIILLTFVSLRLCTNHLSQC